MFLAKEDHRLKEIEQQANINKLESEYIHTEYEEDTNSADTIEFSPTDQAQDFHLG